MEQLQNQFLYAVKPEDFIGFIDIVNNFEKFKNTFKLKETPKRCLLVLGDAGTGKSSLLHKFNSTIIGRKEAFFYFELLPEKQKMADFFKLWLNKADELAPEWRGFFEKLRKKKPGDDLPSLLDNPKLPDSVSFTDFYVSEFMKKLEKINEKLEETKTKLYFTIDNLKIFKLINMNQFYPIFAQIIHEISKKELNILVMSAFSEQYLPEFDHNYLTTNSEILKIEALSSSEAEIFLRRKTPMLVNKGLLDIITNCTKTHFDLNLGIAFIDKGLTIDEFVERNLSSLMDMSSKEKEVLEEIATYNENLFPIRNLIKNTSREGVNGLKEKDILWVGDSFARLQQNALLDAIKLRSKLYIPLPKLIYSINNIIINLEKKIAPSNTEIEKLSAHIKKVKDPLCYFAVAKKLHHIISLCISNEMFYKAYDLTLLKAEKLESVNDYDQAGNTCEEIAREFEEKNYKFAAKLYVKSAKYYDDVDEETKAERAYRRAADQFEKLALSLNVKKEGYAIRGYYKSCIDCYKAIGDKGQFEKIREKAIKVFKEHPVHHEYFQSSKYQKEQLITVDSLPEIEQDKVEKVSIEELDLEKELDF